jgi:queuosine precursor transporter
MLRTDFGTFKYLGLFSALNVTFLLISNFTAARIIGVAGVGVSVTVLYFPLTYLIADILTEVYGYAQARSVIWLSLFCSIVAAGVVDLALLVPPAGFFTEDADYQRIFSAAPKMAIATLLAVFTGDICNSYVLAKLKIWSAGRQLWLRFVVSTVIGEGVNTLVFYGIALYGVLPNDQLVQGILMGWALKTLVEVVLLPVTYPVVAFLKRAEGVDFYDYETDFNPFILAP